MTVNINLPYNKDYNITIDALQNIELDTKVVIVTNPTVSGFHLDYLKNKIKAKELTVCTVPDGEQYKTMQTIEMILEHCFEQRLDRNYWIPRH